MLKILMALLHWGQYTPILFIPALSISNKLLKHNTFHILGESENINISMSRNVDIFYLGVDGSYDAMNETLKLLIMEASYFVNIPAGKLPVHEYSTTLAKNHSCLI